MKAVTWHGKRDVRVDEVPDPTIEQPTDAIIRVTSTAICGSDLHLYEVLGPFLGEGDILGHEPMGIVEEVGAEVSHIAPGDRVMIPFNISCGHCWMCDQGLQTQCETTQNRDQEMGASLFGYTKLQSLLAQTDRLYIFSWRGSYRSRLRVPANVEPSGMSHDQLQDPVATDGAGAIMATISREIVDVYAEYFGRGPTKAKTF